MKKWLIVIIAVIVATIFIGTLTLPRSTPKNIPEFMTWALGDDWREVEKGDFSSCWNERHGDLFVLYSHDEVGEAYTRMYEAWKKQKNNLK